ncbi:MAG: hypothetical protein ABL891_16460 [Burkholderiales bacterium]
MDDIITYVFQIDSGAEVRFDVDLNRPAPGGELPVWTLLEKDKCPHCPLPATPGARCPAAADLVPLVERFSALASIGIADVRVVRSEYEVSKRTDTQTALSAMMGLILATSGCPILSRMRPLAHTHLPFAGETETIYRIVAMHLLACFLDKAAADLKGLEALFTDIDKLNLAFAQRIKRAIEGDASINALVLLHSRNMMASLLIEENLEKIRAWFRHDAMDQK